ncbi:hypothetical protein MPTK1_7g18290 [Marchantia polymorpha subsp. ruderalis]|uniref:Endoplasmic reticulum-based factor for assembly of V-ATPase n=2 Tax=Marchantia polymorpha TaxID=3197 RepID=A0A176WAY0_MARPO|nr:hypothetical protein AXG93_4201s1500 [Marchantia polymorpha subsp. ruderalis]PTQ32135.1 hypothetical protein MARPO_0102s0011 [Marchantia polymorpha]BBN17955.1 hypothetical protein Mp_7g18290 [Marchantia polymorpha subsp. ruderalis]|eukprot:PTQ32135.1 hypothetical protein MARPO_0102s0011 [Marchantia polymorpha]
MGEDGVPGGLKLQNTPKLRDFMKKVAGSPKTSADCRCDMIKYEKESAVPYEILRQAFAQRALDDLQPIHEVLVGSSFVLESPKPREKSEELKARLQKLQELADNKAYEKLVSDVTKKSNYEPEVFSSYKEQLGFGLHVVVTMFTGFAFGYSVFRSQFRDNPVIHAAGGALGLIIGMLLETLLFIVRDAQKAKHEERRSKKTAHNDSTRTIAPDVFTTTTTNSSTRPPGPVKRKVARIPFSTS